MTIFEVIANNDELWADFKESMDEEFRVGGGGSREELETSLALYKMVKKIREEREVA